jgi:ParB family chromosome partitioning protein
LSQALKEQKKVVAEVELWPIGRVLPNPLNPRGRLEAVALGELVASIEAQGILTPLLAVRRGDNAVIVSGHRRRAASERVGLRELPLIFCKLTEQQQLETMLSENIQREDLTPLEEARAYLHALDGCPSKAELARRLGVEVHRLEVHLALLRFDTETQNVFDRRELPISYARALIRVKDPDERRRLVSRAMQGKTPLHVLERVARSQAALVVASPGASSSSAAGQTRAPRDQADAPALKTLEVTRSEADKMLAKGGGPVSFELLRRALKTSCPGCPEASHPELCRACPLPAYVAGVVMLSEREAQAAT